MVVREASKHGYNLRTKLVADGLKSCGLVLERADDPQEKTGSITAAWAWSRSVSNERKLGSIYEGQDTTLHSDESDMLTRNLGLTPLPGAGTPPPTSTLSIVQPAQAPDVQQ
jgi:hypothetical protein